jgi:hypothetical protein
VIVVDRLVGGPSGHQPGEPIERVLAEGNVGRLAALPQILGDGLANH